MSDVPIRLATVDDLLAINDIYNWYVSRSACTYQEAEETIESRLRWFEEKQKQNFPVTVYEAGGGIVGWASLGTYRERSAYRYTVENSLYVHHEMMGRGIGKALLIDSIDRARLAGFKTIIAAIDVNQTFSIALHRKSGFIDVGVQRQVGFKFGGWLDVLLMQLLLK